MKLENMKTMIAGGWVFGACVVAVAGNVRSVAGWTALVGVGVLPALALWTLWNSPEKTMSESISEARR